MNNTTVTIELDCAGAVAVSDALAMVPHARGWEVTITPTTRAYACTVMVPGTWSQEAILRCVIGAMGAWVENRRQADALLLA